jgi:glycosyltransferase involved in cell wall biosynthesis
MVHTTVIIPTYNYAQYITEGIDKAIAQADAELSVEIIVVDDGSTDNTQSILKDDYIATGKIRYFYQHNQGKAAATRKAIELATGKYIFNLDADDYYLPDKIKTFVSVFEKHASIVHVGSSAKVIDTNGKHLSTEIIEPQWADKPVNGIALATYFLKNNTLWAGGTTYAARADVLKALVIPDTVDMYLDEYLILGLLSQGDSFCFTDPLSIWRVHGNNYSNALAPEQKLAKNKRLLQSSEGTLQALTQYSGLPESLFKLYAFKHQTRLIASLEDSHKKSLSTIWQYSKGMWGLKKEGFAFFKRYTSFNRLVPTPIFYALKMLVGKNNQM